MKAPLLAWMVVIGVMRTAGVEAAHPSTAHDTLPSTKLSVLQQTQSSTAQGLTSTQNADEARRKEEERRQQEKKREVEQARKEACEKQRLSYVDAQTLVVGSAPCPEPTSLVDVALGYTVLHYGAADALPIGVAVAVAAKPGRFFGLVSEFSAAYDADTAAHRHTIVFVNGPRLMLPWQRVTVFGEALIGIAHDLDFRAGETDKNRFVWRPGGGIDIRLTTSISMRFQAGRILNLTESDAHEVYQFTSSVVFGR